MLIDRHAVSVEWPEIFVVDVHYPKPESQRLYTDLVVANLKLPYPELGEGEYRQKGPPKTLAMVEGITHKCTLLNLSNLCSLSGPL